MAAQESGSVENDLQIREQLSDLTGDEVVISGISGIFPKSNNVEEFMKNLYDKVDMVSRDTIGWTSNHPEKPDHYGQLKNMEPFDYYFFKIPYLQACNLDVLSRKLLENTYGALFDAGVSPATLKNEPSLGVFTGCSYIEATGDNVYFELKQYKNKYLLTGSCRTMQANRISYWLNGKGSSYSVDGSCCSSIIAFEHAYWALKTGRCSSAIVGGCNNVFNPVLTINLSQAGLLCMDGKTKCFDKHSDGYVRAEAVSVFYLQKASEAKRIYAEIVHMKKAHHINPDTKFLPARGSEEIQKLLQEFYTEAKVSASDVEYVEASAAGIAKTDAEELDAISNVFAKDKAIKVGCVKSNMGHSEGASDACALTKICLAYHKGELPGNLHYKVPHDDVAGVCDGRVQVVTDNVPFERGYAALNSFSFTGINYHALLKGRYKKKNIESYSSAIPRLVLASGAIEKNISKIFDALKSQPIDPEQISLLHDFYEADVFGHTARGYIILDKGKENQVECLAESTSYFSGTKTPTWFLYSGMGSQWAGMGAELMKLPTFAAAIERCHKVLHPKGIDIIKIITDTDETIFDNILYSFVGIAAVQIGLTDLLKELGILPDYIIGHSVGEVGCAYADECLTTEETILSAYYRGLVSIKTKFIDGLMAAVGLGHKEVAMICPPEIEVGCHNSAVSSTISGPAEIIKKFVEELQKKEIFAKVVATGNIAYHSKYIIEAVPHLRSKLDALITSPKLRSKKWICSSTLKDKWDDDAVKYASGEYFTNNLMNIVYFEEAAKNIHSNATIIEISPHCLLQAIVRRSHEECTYVPLTKKLHPSPIKLLLQAVGRLYEVGLNPKVSILYPKVQYPVSTETPMLSQHIEWAYIDDLAGTFIPPKQLHIRMPIRKFVMVLDDDDWKYIKGHEIDGAVIFPPACLLFLVWETLAMFNDMNYRKMSVKFEKVRFEKELYVKKDEPVRFIIGLYRGCNRFQIYQDNIRIMKGIVYRVNEVQEVKDIKTDKIERIETVKVEHIKTNEVKPIESDKVNHIDSDEIQHITSDEVNQFESNEVQHAKSKVQQTKSDTIEHIELDQIEDIEFDKDDNILSAKDIYKILGNKSYSYKDEFQSILALSHKFDKASVRWTKRWVTFIDSLIQLNILSKTHDGVSVPKHIRELMIDTKLHEMVKYGHVDDVVSLNAICIQNDFYNITKCGGVEMLDISFKDKPASDDIVDKLSRPSRIAPSVIHVHKTAATADSCDNNLIQVSCAGLSYYDYQNLIIKGSSNQRFGMDFSGCNCKGERVMGLVSGGSLTRTVVADPSLLWPVPEHWSLQEAATVPLHYAMAYYCLNTRGPREAYQHRRVLIIGGAGALGQALIAVCLALQYTVFATVSNDDKKMFLLNLFPYLQDVFVLNSNSDELGLFLMIKDQTNKALCDLVISCATGAMHHNAMKCVGLFGQFIDLDVHNRSRNENFYMLFGDKDRSYIAANFSNLFKPEYSNQKKLIHQYISEGIAQGIVKPLTKNLHSIREIKSAFRSLASNTRKGKVIIMMDNTVDSQNVTATVQLSLSEQATYLIIGGDSVIDIELIDWLTKQGAKHIVLHQEADSGNSYPHDKTETCQKNGALYVRSTKNIRNDEECDSLLAECEAIAPIHSIFIVHKAKAHGLTTRADIVLNLDKLSRKRCHQLSNFMVISDFKCNTNEDTQTSEIEYICKTRNDNLLPAVFIHQFHTFSDNRDFHLSYNMLVFGNLAPPAVYLRGVFYTVDNYSERVMTDTLSTLFHMLENKTNVAVCGSKSYAATDFCTKISEIIGISDDAVIEENKTLKSLNVSEINLDEISYLINKTFQIDYSNEELQQFTFARFKDMSRNNATKQKTKAEGLEAFINFIDCDEMQANQLIVKMPTKMTSCDSIATTGLESFETHLIMIPGIEGHSRIFSAVGERLKIEAVSLQLAPDLETYSIREMAESLFKYVKKSFVFSSKFYILGYSFGINIALELAALLETEGHLGVIYCLDSSPTSIRLNLDTYLSPLSETELQNLIIHHCFKVMSGSECDELKKDLKEENNWSQKVEIALNKLRPLVTYTREYMRAIIHSVYRRIALSRMYEPNLKLNSDLVLIKGIRPPKADILGDNYDLSKYSNKPVTVFQIQSDHALAPFDNNVSNIVNKMLEPKLLEKYEKLNHCEIKTQTIT